jgi:negative regulator of flagellin synthesis FlgM
MMKVAGTSKTTPLNANATGKSSARAKPLTASSGGQESVSISEKSSILQALEISVNEAPEVDIDKIEGIKQAISEGRFSISSGRVAEKMMSSARELLPKKKA